MSSNSGDGLLYLGFIPERLRTRLSITSAHIARVKRYYKLWDYYNGRHWDYTAAEDETQVVFNYIRKIVHLLSSFTFKRGFSLSVDLGWEGIKSYLDRQWESNGKETVLMNMGISGCITGDVFCKVSWESEPEFDDPFCKVDLIPSEYCFPEFSGAKGERTGIMTACSILYPTYEHKRDGLFKVSETVETVVRAERWTPEYVEHFIGNEKVGEDVNPLGIIPIVHIPDWPVPGQFFGLSTIEDLIEPNKSLNGVITDIQDILEYQASPQTIGKGVAIDKMVRGPDKFWQIPDDGDVYNLEMESDLASSYKYVELLLRMLSDLSGVPRNAFGGASQHVSNTPGVTMNYLYLPMVEVREVKLRSYELGLRRINKLMMKLGELFDADFRDVVEGIRSKNPAKNAYKTNIVWGSALPRDEQDVLAQADKRIKLGLSTQEDELKHLGTEEDLIPDILQRVEENRKKFAESGFTPTGDPLPQRGGTSRLRETTTGEANRGARTSEGMERSSNDGEDT